MVTEHAWFFQRPASTHTKTNIQRNTHILQRHTRTRTESGRANPNSVTSPQASSGDAGVSGPLPRGHQPITLPAGPDRTSEPQGQMLLFTIPSHRLLSAALLMSSSALRSSLTASAVQMDSVTESEVGEVGVEFENYSSGCMCVHNVWICVLYMNGWTNK